MVIAFTYTISVEQMVVPATFHIPHGDGLCIALFLEGLTFHGRRLPTIIYRGNDVSFGLGNRIGLGIFATSVVNNHSTT